MYNVELAVERVILRLETIKELGDIVTDLKPALKLLQSVSQELFAVLPDVSSELGRVNEEIAETLQCTKISTETMALIPMNQKTPGGEEILKEVAGFLEEKLTESLPEPPTSLKAAETKQAVLKEMVALTASCSQSIANRSEESTDDSSQTLLSYKKAEIQEISLKIEKPSIEDVLLEYVRKTNGEVDMSRCTVDLGTSREEIEQALENLGAKGKIKVELKTGD